MTMNEEKVCRNCGKHVDNLIHRDDYEREGDEYIRIPATCSFTPPSEAESLHNQPVAAHLRKEAPQPPSACPSCKGTGIKPGFCDAKCYCQAPQVDTKEGPQVGDCPDCDGTRLIEATHGQPGDGYMRCPACKSSVPLNTEGPYKQERIAGGIAVRGPGGPFCDGGAENFNIAYNSGIAQGYAKCLSDHGIKLPSAERGGEN